MTTIRSLAAEFGALPAEVAAVADLDPGSDANLDPDTVAAIKAAWVA